MFVFSKSIGEKTGNLAVNQALLKLSETPVLRQQRISWRALSSVAMQKTLLISMR